ncbi:MAG: CopG family transcriptional regulator [Clostridiales bacterium]|nr:CopG family transcriptional regulator [Clostridiales bacterium]
MEEKKIKISKKGEDGYRYASIRIKENLLNRIDEIAGITNRSRNELINILLESSIECVEIAEK